MIDPLISLAFSLYSNKGIYALLVGSGVSRSAGIPTGWEIVIDLIRKISVLYNEDCEPDPVEWYKLKFKKNPDYSDLLDDLTKSPAERQQLLKSYFEPNDEELEQGLKVPTIAHKSIAKLMLIGSIKLIVTTNFDRLLEKALEDENITPNVISTVDAIDGSLPLIHSKCTIIKVNGDYLDTRINNTVAELKKYDNKLNDLLNRIFDEFGLIVCGWSADWDIALRSAIERCKNRRFTFYWVTRSELKESAKKLINLRGGIVIKNHDADSFFSQLIEKTEALQLVEKPHPISLKVAVASAKKYLADEKYLINLHDLLLKESVRVSEELRDSKFPLKDVGLGDEQIRRRVEKYESICEIFNGLFITLCYWGKSIHKNILIKSFETIANPIDERLGGYAVLINLKMYPSLYILYSGGIASLVNDNYEYFVSLLTKSTIREDSNEFVSASILNTYSVMTKEVAAMLPDQNMRNYTPLSDHLFSRLRFLFSEIIPSDNQFEYYFDRFEYLLSLVYADLKYKNEIKDFWAPTGSFGWRGLRYHPEKHISKRIDLEIEEKGENWPLIKYGLFNKSVDRLKTIKKKLDEFYMSHGWAW